MDKDYIIECLVNEKKIEAIKYVRTKAGYSLKAAMKYVDDIEKEFSIKGRTSSDLTDMNLFDLAVEFVLERGVVSVSMLQRKLNLGYNDAAKIFELMEYNGIISGYNGSKPRNVIISKYEWNHMRQSVKYKKENYTSYQFKEKSSIKYFTALEEMDGHQFEHFCADLLKKNGFENVSVTPGSGDQGVDVLATKDGIKYAVQCKKYSSALSNTPIQEVAAGRQYYGCHVGVVLTNSTFTNGAIQLANATNVLLWDRAKLEQLIAAAGGLERLGIKSDVIKYVDGIKTIEVAAEEVEEKCEEVLYQESLVYEVNDLMQKFCDELTVGLDEECEALYCAMEARSTAIIGMKKTAARFRSLGKELLGYVEKARENLLAVYKSLDEFGNEWEDSEDSINELMKAVAVSNDSIKFASSFKNGLLFSFRPTGVPMFGAKAAEYKELRKDLILAYEDLADDLKKSNAVLYGIQEDHEKYKSVKKTILD